MGHSVKSIKFSINFIQICFFIIFFPLLTVSHSGSPVTGLVVGITFVVLLIMALMAVVMLIIIGR